MNEWPENYDSLDDTAAPVASMARIGKTTVVLSVLIALAGLSGLTYASDASPLSTLLDWKAQIAEQWGESLGSGAVTF